ncbi:unnamed protein product, partial [Polarella glacialis]
MNKLLEGCLSLKPSLEVLSGESSATVLEPMIKAFVQGQQELKQARREFRNASQALADATEDDLSEESLESASSSLQSAKLALQAADSEAHATTLRLAEQSDRFPEVMQHFGYGVPAELLDLWCPGRSFSHFDEACLLPVASRNRVYRASFQGRLYAVKEFPLSSSQLRTCFREALLLRRLRHPGIVQVEALFFEEGSQSMPGRFYIQMPYYSHGPVDQWVQNCSPDAESIRRVFLSVLQAMSHLHSLGVIHADIKPSNILIDCAGRPHLADFDISVDTATRLTAEYTRAGGTLGFIAPELAEEQGPSTASDMYSFGATLRATMPRELIAGSGNNNNTNNTNNNNSYLDLLNKLMDIDPSRRLSASLAAQHAYFEAAWQWQRHEARRCVICFDTYELRQGLECAGPDAGAGHFMCQGCLGSHVDAEVAKEVRIRAAREGTVCCPVPKCHSIAFLDVDLAKNISAESFARYLQGRRLLLEERMARELQAEMQSQLKAELARMAALDETERHRLQAINHIREHI